MHSKGGVNICFRAKNTRDLLDSQYSNWWMWLCNKQATSIRRCECFEFEITIVTHLWATLIMEFGLYCYSLRLFGEQKTQRAICWAGILVSTRTCPAIYWELFISDHWELPLDKSVLSFLKAVYCSHMSSTISYPVNQMESLPTVWLLVHLSFGCGLKPNLAWENCRAS